MFINKHLFKNKYLLISMIIHKKYVVPEYFDYIKNNQKTCYINLNIGSFSEMKKGDIIIWFYNNENEEKMIKTQIVKIRKFKSFYNGIKNCRLKKIYPNLSNIQDAINLHINNENNLSDENKYGVICIEFNAIL
jgi:ASC-1-like (ASCH) protein